jgi:phage terminase small subunit
VRRRSAEDRSAACWRVGGKPPAPPAHLDDDAKKIWKAIAASRPPDFFTPGALPLLEAYCTALVMHRWYLDSWRRDQLNRDNFVKHIAALNASLSMLATKLRRAITSIDKRSGILIEKGDPSKWMPGGNVTKFRDRDVLFGGGQEKW